MDRHVGSQNAANLLTMTLAMLTMTPAAIPFF
jgi:hypothetical protein